MFDIKKSPTARSRAVRPIGYFAVLQDAEQISVPAVLKRIQSAEAS